MLATPLPTRAATPLSAQDPGGWCSRRASWCGAGLLGVAVLLEAGGDRSVFSLQSNCWDWRPRGDDKQADSHLPAQEPNRSLPGASITGCLFPPATGLCSGSELFANPALIPGSQHLAISNTPSSVKKQKAP